MVSRLVLPAAAGRLSLFLDFDGTLVPIAPSPDAIDVWPGLIELLRSVSDRLSGRLVLVSGRTIADLDRHLDLDGIAVAGSHGHEFRLAADAMPESAPARPPQEIRDMLLERAGDLPGLDIELKRYGVALHYRRAPELAGRIRSLADETARTLGMQVKPGKMVAEILPEGSDKGVAVRTIMAREAFADTVPVFIGDDVTDEDGFRAVEQLGGLGVLVGDREDSAATARLSCHEQVRQLLERIAGER